jgi:hypothetical protein
MVLLIILLFLILLLGLLFFGLRSFFLILVFLNPLGNLSVELVGFEVVAGVDKDKERFFKDRRKKDFEVPKIDRFDLSSVNEKFFGNFQFLVFLFLSVTAILVNRFKRIDISSGKQFFRSCSKMLIHSYALAEWVWWDIYGQLRRMDLTLVNVLYLEKDFEDPKFHGNWSQFQIKWKNVLLEVVEWWFEVGKGGVWVSVFGRNSNSENMFLNFGGLLRSGRKIGMVELDRGKLRFSI